MIRAKPIPEAKKETKWEKFAKEKGIQKKKRARMIWDEQTNEWRPRWGYKRANGGIEDMPIVELKPVSPSSGSCCCRQFSEPTSSCSGYPVRC